MKNNLSNLLPTSERQTADLYNEEHYQARKALLEEAFMSLEEKSKIKKNHRCQKKYLENPQEKKKLKQEKYPKNPKKIDVKSKQVRDARKK